MLIRLTLLILLLLECPMPSHAQWVGSIADPTEPALDAERLDSLSARLALDELQRDHLRQLVAEYEARHADLAARFRECGRVYGALGASPETIKDPRRSALFSERLAIAEHCTLLEEQLWTQVAAALSPDQLAAFDAARRDDRRSSTLMRGALLIAEGVDLVALCERGLDAEQAPRPEPVTALLDEYARVLDEALVRRNRLIIDEEREPTKECRMVNTRTPATSFAPW